MNIASPTPQPTGRPAHRGFGVALAALAAAAILAGCTTSNPDVIGRNDAQRLSTVSDAVVLTTRPVTVDGSQSGIGAAAGSVVGGIAGSSVGGRREAAAVGVIGAVVGGVIGNLTERAATREDALEILVQLKNGDRRAIVQAKGQENFNAGDPVILVASGGKVRVMKAPVVPAAPAAAAPASPSTATTGTTPVSAPAAAPKS